MKKIFFGSLLALASALPALADDKHHKAEGAPAAEAQASATADGVIRKVDKDAQKITIRHGPVPALDMPQAMTMVYRVKDPALLDNVKAGDKVRFEAENISGVFTVTRIESVK